jgi:hypothetical protein
MTPFPQERHLARVRIGRPPLLPIKRFGRFINNITDRIFKIAAQVHRQGVEYLFDDQLTPNREFDLEIR